MKVTTAAFGRFPTFNQAVELEKHGILFEFLSNYPGFMSLNAGIKKDHLKIMLYTGVLHRLNKKIKSRPFTRYLHKAFSKSVLGNLNMDTDIVIGMSSFNFEVIKHLQGSNIIKITDHASVHLKEMRNTIDEEIAEFGLEGYSQIPQWSIDVEDYEFNHSDYIFLCSNYVKETFLSQGYDSRKLVVNNFGVDLRDFKKIKKEDEKFRIIYCGGIKVSKGVHYLLKAFNELNLKDTELWLIGAGYPNKDLDSVIKTMDINFDNVYFKGAHPQKQLYKLFSQGSIFCFPSLSDGFGLVVSQAMACGLPVIVTENTGAKDIVNDNNGFIVPIKNIEALKDKILMLYSDNDLLSNMSKYVVSKKNLSNISWDSYGQRLHDNLKKIMEENG
jgi:glycosyltransferase involved in cell wall biosynthesis